MTTNANNVAANVNPIGDIIKAAFANDEKANGLQNKLVIALADAPATYSRDMIIDLRRLKGAKRSEAVDARISDVSPDFSALCDEIKALKEAADKAKAKLRGEVLNRKRLAARNMFERALLSVFALLASKATKVKEQGSSLKVTRPDNDGDSVTETITGRALTAEGQKAYDTATGKAASTTANTKTNSATIEEGMQNAIKALSAGLDHVTKGKPITDLVPSLAEPLQDLFLKLNLKFYEHDGLVDPRDIIGFLQDRQIKVVNPAKGRPVKVAAAA